MNELYDQELKKLAETAGVSFEAMQCYVIDKAYNLAFSRLNGERYGVQGLSTMLAVFFKEINGKFPYEYQLDDSEQKKAAEAQIEELLREPSHEAAVNTFVNLMESDARKNFKAQQECLEGWRSKVIS